VQDGWLAWSWKEPVEVRVRFEEDWSEPLEVQPPPKADTISWAIAAPYGQEPQPLPNRGEIRLLTQGTVALVGTATEPVDASVLVGEEEHRLHWSAAGEPQVIWWKANDRETAVRIDGEERWQLLPDPRTTELLRDQLSVHPYFPTDVQGRRDASLPGDAVGLPSREMNRRMRAWGLGVRASDAQAPWAFEGIRIENRGKEPIHLLVEAQVRSGEESAPAFAPRLRSSEAKTDAVSALLRVPAQGEAVAVLPVFIDRERAEPGMYTREIRVSRLGDAEPLLVQRREWAVSRGSGMATAGVMVALAAMVAGFLVVALRLRSWLSELPTSALATIALFSTVQLVIGIGAQGVATVVTTAVGPMAPLLTGLVDEIPRMLVWVTLITLLPRRGVFGLAVLVGGFLRLFATGSASVVDVVYVLSSVAWLEAFAWIFGLSRSSAWTDESVGKRVLRLGGALATASVFQAATAMAVHTALYRLFYAPWYVIAVLVLPSWLYVWVACAVAAPFSASLRRIQP